MTASLAVFPAILALAAGPASVGTGIQASPVCLASTARPGGTYTLPPVTVKDAGSGTEDIALQVQQQTGGGNLPGRAVPESWVTFTYPRKWLVLTGSSVSVTPGATAAVPAHLTVPASAKPGPYVSWIIAAPVASTPGHLDLGTAAIADLEFTVAKPGAALRHAACVTPGAKQARKAARTARRHPGNQAAGPAPKGRKVTGSEMLVVLGIAVVLGGVALLRRVL